VGCTPRVSRLEQVSLDLFKLAPEPG
jgi:hypothetical protein